MADSPYICNIVEITRLKGVAKYKHFWAAGLLLVYLFIATPVHWWHQHPGGKGSTFLSLDKPVGKHQLTAHGGGTYSTNCSLCSHHYSVHAATTSWYIPSVTPLYPATHAVYAASVITLPGRSCSNKGPPVLIS